MVVMTQSSTPPLVVRTESLDPEPEAWLAERCEVIAAAPHDEVFQARSAEVRGLLVRTYTTVDSAFLARLPALEVVGRAGVGVDNIDLDACAQRGIPVVHTPDANTQAVVEYVLCLLSDSLRPRVELEGVVSASEWTSLRATICGDRQMNELTLGILGLGRIGQRVAQVAAAIGFRVLYHDILDIPETARSGATPVDFETLMADSNVLSIHVDGRSSNRHIIDTGRLAQARADLVLLNTSRGFVIDEEALATWLAENPSAQAALDVHEHEPLKSDNPLLHLAN
ncbi:MAG: hypothetical protein MK085_13915, partial [Phycisphaerales bacterium]|nr:hypothetical protein [Phycisphaerales bacterium]